MKIVVLLCFLYTITLSKDYFDVNSYNLNGKPYPSRYDINELIFSGKKLIETRYYFVDIPFHIRKKLEKELVPRITNEYYSSMEFVKCNLYVNDVEVDDTLYYIFFKHPDDVRTLKTIRNENVKKKAAGFIFPALIISSKSPEVKGVNYYPNIADNKKRASIITLEKVLTAIYKQNEYTHPITLIYASLRIDSKGKNDLLWLIRYINEADSSKSYNKRQYAYVNAHTGEIVDQSK